MSTRQRQRLLRRRKAAAAQSKSAARKKQGLVTGSVLTAAATALAGSPAAHAALVPLTTQLVSDIRSGTRGSDISQVTAIGSTVFFSASNGPNGSELWKSDGTAAGTMMVKDIAAGALSSGPTALTAVGGTLFFTASDGTSGRELWRSDGTAAGTVMVEDVSPGYSSSVTYGASLTAVGGTLFFAADDGINGRELWKSDGTAAGTTLVKNISATDGYYDGPVSLKAAGGTLFFTASDGTNGRELWKSDGTDAGTVMVKNINTGANSSMSNYYNAMADVSGTLFFSASDGTNGHELWKSNGTDAGTTRVKDVYPGAYSGVDAGTKMTVVGGTLFFNGDNGVNGTELWKSDGTDAGTVMVKDVRPGAGSSLYGYNDTMAAVGGTLFFAAIDGANGRELWKSDGTAAGTQLVKNISTEDYYYGGPRRLTTAGGTLFFTADDGVNGTELWRSDGTADGTQAILDTRPGGYGSDPRYLTAVGGTVFFAARDGVHGQELFKTATPAPIAPGADTTVIGLKVTAAVKQKQPKTKVSVTANVVAAEAISAKATGKIVIEGVKGSIRLSPKTISAAAGQKGTLKLAVSKKQRLKVLGAVKRYRAASPAAKKKIEVRAKISILVTDKAGNHQTVGVTIKLV